MTDYVSLFRHHRRGGVAPPEKNIFGGRRNASPTNCDRELLKFCHPERSEGSQVK